jgi:hypothetical protein
LKIKEKGGDGGHNGLRSLIDAVGTDRLVRVRMGVGRPATDCGVVEDVLGEFDAQQRLALEPPEAAEQPIVIDVSAEPDAIVGRIMAAWPGGGRPKVIATGGLAAVIQPHCPVIELVEPDLTLQGLRMAHEMLTA